MSDSKKLMYALIGVGALVCGAVAFHYLQGKEATSSQCFDEIDQLGPAQKDTNGLLSFPYYKNVFMIISKHAKGKFADEKKEYIIRRRKALKDNNNRDYKEIVKEMI